jgi:hypothetical protein
MAHTIYNNFGKLKQEFKADTQLDADKNMEMYISYFNARMSDKIFQYNHIIATELVNGLAHLPANMRMQIAEMLTSLKKDNLI